MFSEIKLLLFFSSSFFSFVCSVTTSQMSYNRLIEVFVTFELLLSDRMEGIILVFSLKYVERFLVHITKLYNLRITWLLFFLYFWASKIKRTGLASWCYCPQQGVYMVSLVNITQKSVYFFLNLLCLTKIRRIQSGWSEGQ